LNADQKERATAIYKSLILIKKNINSTNRKQLIDEAELVLRSAGFDVDYIEIANRNTLMPWTDGERVPKIALIAATIDSIRLIDNLEID
jgi:pantothenate synthetase